MMLFDSKPEPTRISLQLPDQLVVVSRKKRRRASELSSRAAYHFDTDAEADARDAALTAVASLAGRVDEALRRLDADEAAREKALRAVASLAGRVDDAIQSIEAESAHPE